MNFKTETAYAELDERAAQLWEWDRAFTMFEEDHRWPKLDNNSDHRCRCPKHLNATDCLWYVCYRRIMDAKAGIRPRSAASVTGELRDWQAAKR